MIGSAYKPAAAANRSASRRPAAAALATAIILALIAPAPAADAQTDERDDADGRVVEISVSRHSRVTSFWLDNGVRVHHRLMRPDDAAQTRAATGATPALKQQEWDTPAGSPNDARQRRARNGGVVLRVHLAGGELLEAAGTRGLSWAMTASWKPGVRRSGRDDGANPGNERVWGEGARPKQLGDGVTANAYPSEDGVVIVAESKAGDAQALFAVVREMLTEPRLDDAVLESWRAGALDVLAERSLNGQAVALDGLTGAMIAPGQQDVAGPSVEEIEAITLEAVLRWQGSACRSWPIEVAVVGDVSAAEAIRLSETYLGGLWTRKRVGPGVYGARRQLVRREGPYVLGLAGRSPDDRAHVVEGFVGADLSELDRHRALVVAARVVKERAAEKLRAAGVSGATVEAQSVPATVYPGFGAFLVTCDAAPDHTAAVVEALAAAIADVHDGRVSDEAMRAAIESTAHDAREYVSTMAYWSGYLSRSTLRGLDPEAMVDVGAAYLALTPSGVVETVRSYNAPAQRIRVVVTPTGWPGVVER